MEAIKRSNKNKKKQKNQTKSNKQNPSSDSFSTKFYHTFNEELISILLNLFYNLDSINEENVTSIFLVNIDAKNNKILTS